MDALYAELVSTCNRLRTLLDNGKITDQDLVSFCEAADIVIAVLARKQTNILRKVDDFMGGKVLELKIDRLMAESRFETLASLVKQGLLTVIVAAEQMNITVEEFTSRMEQRQ